MAHRVLARIAFVTANVATARRHLSAALAIVGTAELPLAACKVYGAAAAPYGKFLSRSNPLQDRVETK
ncbi:hypothetical protein [Bradyrhizobium sp. Ash2021]|uniref:hypothetical protein n=1 Tax=Bradyrhizobium sp. Ash2021 TaxID=2954771 RepID=UPI002815F579|nr:hypothetical protein [Bradyrhizobium sp. Ash2021]WMT72659.1 hypothetical protein NL528_32260 [Bradyrhizobium sp. Ash2021]